MRLHFWSKLGCTTLLGALLLGTSCSDEPALSVATSTFRVQIQEVNGSRELPTADSPLPANRGDTPDTWAFEIEARSPTGGLVPFDGVVRLSTKPGAVISVSGEGATGRNIRLKGGKASGTVTVTAVYGPSRLWVEDLGYIPGPGDRKPRCADGTNDDPEEDELIDFPNDPGCAFADDDTEEGGTFAAGVSLPIQYALPTLSDVQGDGSKTPYPYESIEINTSAPQRLVVTRISSDGLYVTDVAAGEQQKGYNHLFAFNFSTPPGVRVCDRVTYLAGTLSEFFGFTELNFPSYRVIGPIEGKEPCEVPEPFLIDDTVLSNPMTTEKVESGLVRVVGYHVAKYLGSKVARNNIFAPDQSNCDINEDGQIDFNSPAEAS